MSNFFTLLSQNKVRDIFCFYFAIPTISELYIQSCRKLSSWFAQLHDKADIGTYNISEGGHISDVFFEIHFGGKK